MKVNNS